MVAEPSRRLLLRRVALSVAGIVVVAAGWLGWATQRPLVTLARGRCSGDAPVKKKALVVYATRAGSTAEVAQAISQRLCANGWDADLQPVEAAGPLASYEAVVLGSAIRYSAWLPEMTEFITSHRGELARLPLAIFSVHMQALGSDDTSRASRAGYTRAVHELVSPRDEVFLAGKIDPSRLSFLERMAVKLVKSPVGDKRDWLRIQQWTDGLASKLQ
jgi:menaquinone-dependent protoporphyrinogen oxidase